jgi:hypothetical protein
MRFNPGLFILISVAMGPAALANGQTPTEVALCDPFLAPGDNNDDSGNEEDQNTERRARYDLETSEPLTSEEAVMDAIYEEKWDLTSLATVARPAICVGQDSYVVNWAEVMGKDDQGEDAVIARGFFRIAKDGTFQFDYAKRPYTGTWQFKDGQMVLDAGWLNQGEPLAATVEKVQTPIELVGSDGATDSYLEEIYRIGPFRLLPIDTTARGMVQDCACPAN